MLCIVRGRVADSDSDSKIADKVLESTHPWHRRSHACSKLEAKNSHAPNQAP